MTHMDEYVTECWSDSTGEMEGGNISAKERREKETKQNERKLKER